MMKKYMTPEMEIIELHEIDVVRTSGEPEMDAGDLDFQLRSASK